MAQHPETIAFLQELRTPTHHDPAGMSAWGKSSAAVLTLEGQQVAKLRGLLQEMDESEDNPLIVSRIETIQQQLDARTRILGEVALRHRKLKGIDRDLDRYIELLRTDAATAGYTVP